MPKINQYGTMKKRPFRFRFGLRSFLVFVAGLSLFLSVRVYERKVLLNARHQIESRGGTVFYSWQQPVLRKELRRRTETGSPVPSTIYTYTVKWVETADDAVRGSEFEGFLSGRHDAIRIEAVDLKIQDIDDEIIDTLKRLKHLKTLRVQAGVMREVPESWSGTRGEWVAKNDAETLKMWQLLKQLFPDTLEQ